MDDIKRSVLWHRLISEVSLAEYYGLKELWTKQEKLIQFSEDNPADINEASEDIKEILLKTIPEFLKKYPEYKDAECLKVKGQ